MTTCDACLRRTRLLAALAGYLDHLHARRGMLDEVFALADDELVEALVPAAAGRRHLRDAQAACDPVAERARARAAGLDGICRHDPAYPASLSSLQGQPAVLFARSSERFVEMCRQPSVAIVGARRASSYGSEVARTLGRDLAVAGVTVVSGMAFGVDAAAHEGALEVSGRTIAVLAGGADVTYPATKRALHRELGERAAVVAEMPPGFRPRRWAFPARNRVIAGLADLTVVVEAGSRSGALITARIAREIGRDVAAVPGRVTSPLAAGPNSLLRDGAHVLDGPQAALDLLFGVGVRRATYPEQALALDERLRTVLRAVSEGRDTVTELAAGGDARPVLAALGELELAGRVRRTPGGAYVALSYPEET